MAEAPPKDGFGVKKTPGPSAVPPAAPAPEKTIQGSLLHESHHHGYHKGRREEYGKGVRHGMAFAVALMCIGFVFAMVAKASWRESDMIDNTVAVQSATRWADILSEHKAKEEAEKRFPVVEK